MLFVHDRIGGRAGAARAAVVALLAGAAAIPPSAAQPIMRGEAGEVGRAMPTTDTRSADEHGAASLLHDALARLAEGRERDGQRLLELLIARYPESAAATKARRRLARLYGAIEAGTPGAPVGGGDGATAAAPPAAETQAAHPTGPWRVDVRRHEAAAEDFRIKAGDRIFFSSGSSELGGRARAVLQAQARWLNRFPDLVAVVEGHADDPGDDTANRELSRQRAEAVRARLIEEGVAGHRLAAVARGRTDRVAECGDPACAAHNRRTVTSLIMTEPDQQPTLPGSVGERGRLNGQEQVAPPAATLTGARGQGQ